MKLYSGSPLRLNFHDICDVCGEFETIKAKRLDGKKYCGSCYVDLIKWFNRQEPTYRNGIPPNEETIDELRRIGWLRENGSAKNVTLASE